MEWEKDPPRSGGHPGAEGYYKRGEKSECVYSMNVW